MVQTHTPSPENPGLLNWILVITLGVIWGAAFMSVAVALEGFGPRTVAAGRTGIAAVTLLILGALFGQPITQISQHGGARAWIFVCAIGSVAIAMPVLMLTWGQQYVPSAFAGVTMGAVPLMVLPLVYIFSPEEGIGPRRVVGMLIGFVGLYILVGTGAFENTGSDVEFWGRIACVSAAFGYAVGSVLTRRAPPMPPIALATGTLVVAACVVVPFALLTEDLPDRLSLTPSLALLYAALLPTAIAAIIRVRVITTAGSLFMNMTSYMVPAWSVIFGIVLLGEDLPPQLFSALVLILIGIAISQSRQIMAALRRS